VPFNNPYTRHGFEGADDRREPIDGSGLDFSAFLSQMREWPREDTPTSSLG
jgi:hypothetical protein